VSRWFILTFVVLVALTGCKREEAASVGKGPGIEQPGDAMPPASPRGIGNAPEAATNPVVIADTGDINATLQQLTKELRDFVVRTRSVPKNFEEFAAKSQISFPPPPQGKKYVIVKQEVVLQKR
jgi:hypothetical protein